MTRLLIFATCCLLISTMVHGDTEEDKSSFLFQLDEVDSRKVLANKILRLGEEIDWREHNLKELEDTYLRINLMHKLAALGESIPWQDFDADTLSDFYSRAWKANYLAQHHNILVDWRRHDIDELEEMKERNRFAHMLEEDFGNRIDWTSFSLPEMRTVRRKMILAENLSRRQGRKIDWRTVEVAADPLDRLDDAFTSLVRDLAVYADTTVDRVMALTEKASELLAEKGVEASVELLTTAAWEIHSAHRFLDVQTSLAGYSAYRIEGRRHADAIDQVIEDYLPKEPKSSIIRIVIVSDSFGEFEWRFTMEKLPATDGKSYYSVVGTIENRGKTEYTTPEKGVMMLLVDQNGNEYSPESSSLRGGVVLRPMIPEAFSFKYEVARGSIPNQFKIREMDDKKDQFDSDRFKQIPWPKP